MAFVVGVFCADLSFGRRVSVRHTRVRWHLSQGGVPQQRLRSSASDLGAAHIRPSGTLIDSLVMLSRPPNQRRACLRCRVLPLRGDLPLRALVSHRLLGAAVLDLLGSACGRQLLGCLQYMLGRPGNPLKQRFPRMLPSPACGARGHIGIGLAFGAAGKQHTFFPSLHHQLGLWHCDALRALHPLSFLVADMCRPQPPPPPLVFFRLPPPALGCGCERRGTLARCFRVSSAGVPTVTSCQS